MNADKTISVEAEKSIAAGASGKAKIMYPIDRRGEEVEVFNPGENPSVAAGKLVNVMPYADGKLQIIAAEV